MERDWRDIGEGLERYWRGAGEILERDWRDIGEGLERYWRGAGEILERDWRDIGEGLERYWRGTGEILERCWRDGEGMERLTVSRHPNFFPFVGNVAAAKLCHFPSIRVQSMIFFKLGDPFPFECFILPYAGTWG